EVQPFGHTSLHLEPGRFSRGMESHGHDRAARESRQSLTFTAQRFPLFQAGALPSPPPLHSGPSRPPRPQRPPRPPCPLRPPPPHFHHVTHKDGLDCNHGPCSIGRLMLTNAPNATPSPPRPRSGQGPSSLSKRDTRCDSAPPTQTHHVPSP